MKVLNWLTRSPKQNYVQDQVENYLALIDKCADHFVQSIDDYLTEVTFNEEFISWAHETRRYESEGDENRREIERVMYAEGLIPQSRGDLLGLLEAIDRLPNKMSTVVQLPYTENLTIPSRYREEIRNLAETNVQSVRESVQLLRSFVHAEGDMAERISRIQNLEGESDTTERQVIFDLFRTEGISDPRRILLRDFILEMGAISDHAENFADRVGVCSVKRLF